MSIHKSIDQEHEEAIQAIVLLARDILAGRYQILKGVCELYYLCQYGRVSLDEPFDTNLRFIESDCQGLPLFDDFRAKCSSEYLERQEPNIRQFEEAVKNEVIEICNVILRKFGTAGNTEVPPIW